MLRTPSSSPCSMMRDSPTAGPPRPAPSRRPGASDRKGDRPMPTTVAGFGPGERRLNGVQTTGRDYRNLSEPAFGTRRTNDVEIEVRDGTVLMADLFRPDADGRFPALVSFSPYPRQIQDVGAPLGFIEAGASRLLRAARLRPRDRQRPRHRRLGRRLRPLRRAGARRPPRPRRMGGRPALVRRQRRDARHQLLRHGAARRRRDEPPHLKAIAPLAHHRRPLRGGVPPRPAQRRLHLRLAAGDRGDVREARRLLARRPARSRPRHPPHPGDPRADAAPSTARRSSPC